VCVCVCRVALCVADKSQYGCMILCVCVHIYIYIYIYMKCMEFREDLLWMQACVVESMHICVPHGPFVTYDGWVGVCVL
jgi:hypothetical protein